MLLPPLAYDTTMVENFNDIVEHVRENASNKLQPEVVSIDGSDPHIYLTLDAPVQISRREFLTKLGGELERNVREITLKFLDASNTTVNGTDGVRYRLRVDEVEENPL